MVWRWSQFCNSGSFQNFPKHNLQSKQWYDSDDWSSQRFCGYIPRIFSGDTRFSPVIGGFFRSLPNPFLDGAKIVIFGTVAAVGMNIIATMGCFGRGEMWIVEVALGIGVRLAFVPEVLSQTPKEIQ